MTEWICMECETVFLSGVGKHCGKQAEPFELEKHGRRLIGLSNSWISVWEKWKDNEKFLEVSNELSNEGSYGAATAINEFIQRLVDRADQ